MHETLYLHIGWSKTGTSAIQEQLDKQNEKLYEKGILYSKTMQMNDNAHHHFALAFNNTIPGYSAKYTPNEVIEIINNEMKKNDCHSTLISSELSPFYPNSIIFRDWLMQFKTIKVISTIRKQSELILSLYNQLIKDSEIRYKGSIFQLMMNNLEHLNYFINLEKWHNITQKENFIVLRYTKNIVSDFLSLFDLEASTDTAKNIVNPSLPLESLLMIQEHCAHIQDPLLYEEKISDCLDSIKRIHAKSEPTKILITSSELESIDEYFQDSNNKLAKYFFNEPYLFPLTSYQNIKCY